MNWRRAFVEHLDRTAGLLTLLTYVLDARFGTGVIERRWVDRESGYANLAQALHDLGEEP